jgi:hypothetical protein
VKLANRYCICSRLPPSPSLGSKLLDCLEEELELKMQLKEELEAQLKLHLEVELKWLRC